VTQKIHRQPSVPKSTPPSAGPMLKPTAWAADMIPKACPRRAGPAAATRITTLLAPSKAPLMPCSTRKPMRAGRLGARPHNAEHRPNSTKPERYSVLRPAISAKRAKTGSTEAKASM
jgi:hypothetical protein